MFLITWPTYDRVCCAVVYNILCISLVGKFSTRLTIDWTHSITIVKVVTVVVITVVLILFVRVVVAQCLLP